MADSNQEVVQHATAALTGAIKASANFASWIGWEALQRGATLQQAINIENAIKAGNFSLDDLMTSAQSKVSGTYTNGIAGEPDPTLKVLGMTFDIGDLLGATKVEQWSSGNAKNPQYHSREYFTSVGDDAPKGYDASWNNPNKAPVANADAVIVNEDDAVITGSVAANDSDANNDALIFKLNGTAPAGLTFNANGSYSFDASAYQSLAAGEKLPIVVSYTVDDGMGGTAVSTLTITVTGTNDKPTAVADTHAVLEDNVIQGSVATNDSDVDNGSSLSYALKADVAGLTLNADGSYTFDAGNAAYAHLASNAVQNVVATYNVTDEHGATAESTLTIKVTGFNDYPVALAQTEAVDEGSIITGAIKSTDVDDGAVAIYSQIDDGKGLVPGFTLKDDGTYTFDAGHAAYQHLAEGKTTDVKVHFSVDDKLGGYVDQYLTITVTGTNDKPTAVADTHAVLEDNVIQGSVATNDSDVDNGSSLSYALKADVAGLTLNADGSYTFDAGNAAYAHLASNAVQNVVATYNVTDEHGATAESTLTIKVTGFNDYPVALAQTEAVDEGSIITGAIKSTDVDDGAVAIYSQIDDGKGLVPGFTLKDDGTYTFDAGHAAYQHLAEGKTTDVKVHFSVDDKLGGYVDQYLTITVTGTNDKPTAEVVEVSGAENSIITGSVHGADVDDGAVLTYSLDAPVKGLTFNDDGSYTFDAGNKAYQGFAEGEKVDVTANYTVTDEHGAVAHQSLTLHLTGVNDAPVVLPLTADAGENTPPVTITASFKDADSSDSHTFSVDTTGTKGSVTNNGDGTFSYQANGKFESLANGESATDVFKYTVDDGKGAKSTESVTVTIHGQNDIPVVKSWSVSASETDSAVKGKGVADILKIDLLNGEFVSDVDHGDTLHVNAASIKVGGQSLPSYMKLDADGHTLLVDLNSTALDSLHKGAHLLSSIGYDASDGQGATVSNSVSLDITGTADQYSGSVTGHGEKTAHNPSNGSDIAQKFSFDLHTDDGAFNFTNAKVTVVVQGDIDANNETAIVADVNSADFTGFTIVGGGAAGQVDGPDPDNVTRSGSATVNAPALADGHVDFDVTLADKIDSDNHTTVDATLSYDYWA